MDFVVTNDEFFIKSDDLNARPGEVGELEGHVMQAAMLQQSMIKYAIIRDIKLIHKLETHAGAQYALPSVQVRDHVPN